MIEMKEQIGSAFGLCDAVVDRLEFSYKTFTAGGKPKTVRLESALDTFERLAKNNDGTPKTLRIDDFDLKV